MDISVCMIVRNEEAVLERSLQSLGPLAAEIIVVDTGSIDRTKEIARSYTDKVYDYQWHDNFAEARNFSLAQATKDWVLVLDADETVITFDCEQIHRVLVKPYQIGRIKLVNILAGTAGEQKNIERVSRLLNRDYYHFEGVIHEQAVRNDGLPSEKVSVEITVEHIGYTEEVLKRTNKIARNLTLLERALARRPEDLYLIYQLGKSYYLAKDFSRAIEHFQKVLNITENLALEYIENMVEMYGYALINSGRYFEALALADYASYYSGIPDYQFMLGHVYMNNGMFAQAVESFKKCIGSKPGRVEGVNACLPNYNIGIIYECLGDLEAAKNYYRRCGRYQAALNRIALLNTTANKGNNRN